LTVVARSELMQSASRAADHAVPVPGSGLPKLAHRPIPRTVVPISGPAEVGVETVQYPNRFAKCTGQMCNRSIDADYKIEAVYESRRVGKVMEILGEIVQLHAL